MKQWLCHPTHLSWCIAAASAGLVAGTALARVLPVWADDPIWLGLAALLAVMAYRKRQRWLLIAACAAGICCGGYRGLHVKHSLQAYQPFYGRVVQAEGVLREDVSRGKGGEIRFELSAVRLEGRELPGHLWLSNSTPLAIKRGDQVTVHGRLTDGFGTLPASMYRAVVLSVRRSSRSDVAGRVRDWFGAGVRQAIPEPQAALGIGYLTGQRSNLPSEFDEQLRTVGLTHAVVASGYNLTILVSFARRLLLATSKYLATLVASGMITGFILVTGFSPSMVRAALVSGLSLAAWYYGRVVHPLVLLPLTAALTVLAQPEYAWGDIGWCLSFAAFSGVIILAPLLQSYFWPPAEKPPLLLGLFMETVAAQAATLPIILYSFSQYATYAIPANLLVVPFIPIAMLSTFVAGLTALAIPALARAAAWPATELLRYMTQIVERLAALPEASHEIHFNGLALVAAYAMLSLLSFWLWHQTGCNFRDGKGS